MAFILRANGLFLHTEAAAREWPELHAHRLAACIRGKSALVLLGFRGCPAQPLHHTRHARIVMPDLSDEQSQPSGGKRILLVDDDNEIVESLKLALEARGYKIMVARDGNQGLAMAEREDPDLVILDMMMPKRSGFLVLEKLRRTRPVPMRVIMITANEGSRHKAYAEMLGVDDYIRKPFAMDRLMESVERLLS